MIYKNIGFTLTVTDILVYPSINRENIPKLGQILLFLIKFQRPVCTVHIKTWQKYKTKQLSKLLEIRGSHDDDDKVTLTNLVKWKKPLDNFLIKRSTTCELFKENWTTWVCTWEKKHIHTSFKCLLEKHSYGKRRVDFCVLPKSSSWRTRGSRLGWPFSVTTGAVMKLPLPITGNIFLHSSFQEAYCFLKGDINNT